VPDAPFHYRIAGAYFESCNCDAICPCRTVGGVVGGSSTHGVCFGILSWHVCNGHANDIPVDGLNAALVYSYSDDEEGSPWGFNLHVDERGDDAQRAALADILVGNVGGKLVLALPWVRKPSELFRVEASRIEFRRVGRHHEVRVGEFNIVKASREFETQQRVSCIVPGHHIAGTELYAERLAVADDPFVWDLTGNCAFVSDFEYCSDDESVSGART